MSIFGPLPPRADYTCPSRARGASLDHLVGAQQNRWGYGKTERRGGLEVQDHLEFCRKTSVYQLVRENQQVWWNLEAELFSGFQIDDEIKFIRVSDRQVSGFCAF
jgi:hypothetical protein